MDMRISELSKQSAISVASIKYYLREGLLHPGTRTGVNQATYDQSHLDRLRLIHVLTKIVGLPINKTAAVLQFLSGEANTLDALAVVQDALASESIDKSDDLSAVEIVQRTVAIQGWNCSEDSIAFKNATQAVAALEREKLTPIIEQLNRYANAADMIGRLDIDAISMHQNPEEMAHVMALGSILRKPALDALILLAQQHYASMRFEN